MGAAHAVGVDIDPVAERIAGENAALNGVQGDRYTVLCGDVLTDGDLVNRLAQSTYDIVVANIVADVIIGLCPVVPRFLKQDGLFIMSGIIKERLPDVLHALEAHGFQTLSIQEGEDWRAILAKRT